MRWTILASFLVGCSSQQVVHSNADRIIASAMPINNPISITYRESKPEKIRILMSMDLGNGPAKAASEALQYTTVSDDISIYHFSIQRMIINESTFGCVDQPIIAEDIVMKRNGELIKKTDAEPVDCPSAKKLKEGGGSNPGDITQLWIYPQTLQTGTILRKRTTADSAVDETTGVVIGRADWNGRPVIVIQLKGCTRLGNQDVSFRVCPEGVNLVDPFSGLIVGGYGQTVNEAMKLHAEVQMEPSK